MRGQRPNPLCASSKIVALTTQRMAGLMSKQQERDSHNQGDQRAEASDER
jgi:hypothetical protein